MKKRNQHILSLGENGFPIGFAAIQRQKLIAKGLAEQGYTVTVLSAKGVHNSSIDFPVQGEDEGILYKFTSGSIHKPKSGFKRNWLKIVGKWKEFAYIRSLKRTKQLKACVVSTRDIEQLVFYRLWLKWLNIPMLLDYCELYSAIASRKKGLNDYFFDRYAPKLCDGIMPISDYLANEIKRHAPNKPLLKIPIICDFNRFSHPIQRDDTLRLLYCGSPSYVPIVQFVLNAFDKVSFGNRKVELMVVMGGKTADLEKIAAIIAKAKHRNHISFNTNVSDEAIPVFYSRATALLIPLRDTIQDTARFPHKVGESLASKCTIITTAFGEINAYDFTHQKTAFIAKAYDETVFAEQIQYVINHPEEATTIGKAAHQLAAKEFDYKIHGKKLNPVSYTHLTLPTICSV